MPAPKSVTKVTKEGLEFTSNVDYCQYTIRELCRGALRDVAKFVRKEFKKRYYEQFHKMSGEGGKSIKAKVWSSENTKFPRVDIGLKKGQVDGFYSLFQEVGTSRQPKLGLLQKSVEENIDSIIEIQSKYLSAIDTGNTESLIDETELDIEED